MRVKTHPLMEILAKKLFSIERVPEKEQLKMKNRAIKAAVKWHEEDKKEVLNKIKIIANNALYFTDNSDYKNALWDILTTISPDIIDEDGTPREKLKYIEEK